MSRKIIQILCILTIAALAFGGCAKVTEKPSENFTSGDFSKKIKITWGYFDGIGEDELYNFISKKFNVDIELIPIGWNERKEQVNTMIAAGDMPDILFYEMDRGQFIEMIEDKVVREIPAIDEKKWPDLSRIAKKMDMGIKESQKDGKLYAWPKYYGDLPLKNEYDTFAFVYRKDWAEKLGLAKSDDIYTIDEAVEMARQFIAKDPGNLGKGKTIGIADQDFSSPSLMGAFSVYGNPSTMGYVKQNGKYVWGPSLQETKDGIKYLKKIYDEGIYWKDFYTAKGYDAHKLYEAGRVGIYYDNFTVKNLFYMREGFRLANPGLDVDKGTAMMYIKGKDGKFWSREFPNYWSFNIYSPAVDDEKMDRILYIQDWLASDEGSKYCWYGIKGTDWTETDGKVELKWQKDAAGKEVRPVYATLGIRAMTMLDMDYQFVAPTIGDSVKQDLIKWNDLRNEQNTSLNKFDENIIYNTSPNYLKYANFFLDYQDQLKKLLASSKNVEADYEKWLKEMEPKINKVLEELNK